MINELAPMIGQTMVRVVGEDGDDTLDFIDTTGTTYRFYHEKDCCEYVGIEDIVGDLSDLVGAPILTAEEISSDDEPPPKYDYEPESYTWTFYRFATVKGTVTVRWLGTSNGYYSESVSFVVLRPEER